MDSERLGPYTHYTMVGIQLDPDKKGPNSVGFRKKLYVQPDQDKTVRIQPDPDKMVRIQADPDKMVRIQPDPEH